ncbi:glutamate-1-semialdehyde 2,1-aminomutase [Nitzschia inconspicua]|uniref:Glutamate-1-semialdehyde 2,1-aminomutase n=1 Tax=Nitzschia inconspicua TaxID=303405 RepID=A0A9K3Q5Q5_9STRA|nr:glutamate-1-semialdehyde 2,1-aminomutase [Nitzschia inconspicua]
MKSEIATLYESFLEHVDVCDRRQITGFLVKSCFAGSDTVDALIKAKVTSKREEAVYLIRRLQKELRLFSPVRGNDRFQDSKRHYYRLTVQKSIQNGSAVLGNCNFTDTDELSLNEKATVFFQLAEVNDYKRGMKKYYSCFVGCDVVDRMVYSGLVKTRLDGVLLGRSLARDMELFDHVNHKNYFTDDSSLYFFAPGVLKIIYELQQNAKSGDGETFFQSEKVQRVVTAFQHRTPSSESKRGALERLLRGRSKHFQFSNVSDTMEVSDDEGSALSAPEMTESSAFVEDSKESVVSRSTSFDTLNDIILKHGGLLESDSVSLYSTFEDSYGYPQDLNSSNNVHLGGAENIEEDGTRIRYQTQKKNKAGPPSSLDDEENSVLYDDHSLISEADELFGDSPRDVANIKTLTRYPVLRKRTLEKSNSLPQVQSALYLSCSDFSTIVVKKVPEDEMTQLTMDKCLAATEASSEQDDGVVTNASTEEDIGRLLSTCHKPGSKAKGYPHARTTVSQGSSDHSKQGRPISCSTKLSHQSTSSSFLSTSSAKQRLGKILRKDLWSCDEDVVAMALDELCEALQVDLGTNGAHVVYCGGVMALKRTLENYVQVEAIQYHGCFALGQLASLDMDTRNAIAEMDGIPLVVQSMQHHVESSRMQEAGRSALASICWRSDV